MRRTARALSVAALAGVVLGFAASAVFAEPTAQVSPGSVAPGGSVTISVSCDPLGGTPPTTLEATSQAFEEGTVELKRVSGNDEKDAGPAYSGTARIPPAENVEAAPDAVGSDSAWTVDGTCPAASGGEGKPWSATLTVALDSSGGTGGAGGSKDGGKDGGEEGMDGGEEGMDGGKEGTEGGGMQGGTGGTDGGGHPCAEPQFDKTEPHSGMTEPDKTKTRTDADTHTDTGTAWEETGGHAGKGESHSEDCAGDATDHGVQAGAGGTFTDSVPALVAGGFLIAGAAGGAVYRLRRKTPTAED